MSPKASLIIAFYNNPEYLKLVLAGFESQSFSEFEIIIADDGSNKTVVSEIEKVIYDSPLNIQHVWHPDEGWRKNRILNKAVITSLSDYLIFIDGDCVPHRDFVKEHFENRKKKTALTGRRVNLSEKFTSRITPEYVKSGELDNSIFNLIIDGIFGGSFDVEKGFYFKSAFLRNYFNKKKRGLLGCNFSIHKDELVKINGFDERYDAPAIGEDTDVQYRYELSGGKVESLNNIAVQYHLYHKIRPRESKNLELFERVKKENSYYTSFGIIKS